MKELKGTKAIKDAIASIARRGARLDADIQQAGLAVMGHASEHGDTTLADSLVNAMAKGSRRVVLVEWLLQFSQLALLDQVADKDAIAAGRVFKLDRTRNLDLAGAGAILWADLRKQAEVATAFDVQAAVKHMVKRFQSATAKGLKIEHKAQAVQELEALLTALKA